MHPVGWHAHAHPPGQRIADECIPAGETCDRGDLFDASPSDLCWLHPELYSIIGNLVAGVLLVWLWVLGASLAVIAGGYLILSGIVRFMEEGYRGEPQTRHLWGMPIYQWLSILTLLAGMLVMLIAAPPAPMLRSTSLGTASILGVVFFFICWFAYGIDFPNSRARYSRLSG